jgi:hypothetical protein
MRSLDIQVPVANDERLRQIDIHFVSRSEQHAGIGFTAITSGFGVVNTSINGIELRMMRREFGAQNTMDFFDGGFIEISTAYTGLIRDYDGFHALFVDFSNRKT